MILQHVYRTLPLLCLVLLAGCSGSGGTVSGNVKVDGQPLAEGSISFNAVDGNSPSKGGPIKDGAYSVADVRPGTQKVVINAPKVTGSRPAYAGDPNSPQIKVTEETLPRKISDPAQTELTVEVNGNTKKDFDLSTKP
jgi:hypothetical protein